MQLPEYILCYLYDKSECKDTFLHFTHFKYIEKGTRAKGVFVFYYHFFYCTLADCAYYGHKIQNRQSIIISSVSIYSVYYQINGHG